MAATAAVAEGSGRASRDVCRSAVSAALHLSLSVCAAAAVRAAWLRAARPLVRCSHMECDAVVKWSGVEWMSDCGRIHCSA